MGNIDRRLSGTLLERLFYFWGRLHFEYNLTPFSQKLGKLGIKKVKITNKKHYSIN